MNAGTSLSWLAVLSVSAACAGDDGPSVGPDPPVDAPPACSPVSSFCAATPGGEACEDWDESCSLNPAWAPRGTASEAFSIVARGDAPSPPRSARFHVPAFGGGPKLAALERTVSGAYNRALLGVNWSGVPTFPAGSSGTVRLAWMQPRLGANPLFSIGLMAKRDGLFVVMSSATSGTRTFPAGALPRAGEWHRAELFLELENSLEFSLTVDDLPRVGSTLGAPVTSNSLVAGFGLDLTGPLGDADVFFDDIIIDRQ